MFEIIQNSCSKKSVFSQKYFVWLLKIFKIPQTCFQQIFHSFFSIILLSTSRKLLDYKNLDFKKNIKFDFKEEKFLLPNVLNSLSYHFYFEQNWELFWEETARLIAKKLD